MWVRSFFGNPPQDSWQDIARRKAADTASRIPKEWRLNESQLREAHERRDLTGDFITGLLPEKACEITALSAPVLAEGIRQTKFSAREVAEAFCRRAAVAHQVNNCLHEIFFELALERAGELDDYQKKHGKVIGPLHGVPISLKDQFYVKGVETTMGYVGWIDSVEGDKQSPDYKVRESVVVRDLFKLGAVLYCKAYKLATNITGNSTFSGTNALIETEEHLQLGETHNNIFGYTMNPVNQALSCGGSSGGEGALAALGGSCLGIGTDIGGSVRIPAAFCGIYSIKPSFARFSYKDVANSNPGQTILKSAVGFMSTSLASLKFLQTSLLSTKPWISDAEVVPMPWRPDYEMIEKTLCFGLLKCDGHVMPHPPILRALGMLENALKSRGHRVATWNPPRHRDGSHLHNEFMTCDGGANIWTQLNKSGEPPIEELADEMGKGPTLPMPLLDFQSLSLKREAYRQNYREYWNSTIELTGTGRPVDAFIMPVAPHAAVIPGRYYHYDYSDIVNLLDYTSVVIPVTKADKDLDTFDKAYKPLNDTDKKNHEAYDAGVYDGAPVGIQIVARQFQEERCLALANEIVTALQEPSRTRYPA